MRSAFGDFAQSLRLREGMKQKDFAAKLGCSVPRVSAIEHGRSNINEHVLRQYIELLAKNDAERNELVKRAGFSNDKHKLENRGAASSDLAALLSRFGDELSDQAKKQIRAIIEAEVTEAAELHLSINQSKYALEKPKVKKKSFKRPQLERLDFINIALTAENHRQRVAKNNERICVEAFLTDTSNEFNDFDVDVLEALPAHTNAFASIRGHAGGCTLLVADGLFDCALKGNSFARHALLHEYAHYVLDRELLRSEAVTYLPSQDFPTSAELSLGQGPRHKIIDTIIEERAECFSVMFLVPWTEMIKGTSDYYLAMDFGEEKESIERYSNYMKQPAVIEGFKKALWDSGKKSHPIFVR